MGDTEKVCSQTQLSYL